MNVVFDNNDTSYIQHISTEKVINLVKKFLVNKL